MKHQSLITPSILAREVLLKYGGNSAGCAITDHSLTLVQDGELRTAAFDKGALRLSLDDFAPVLARVMATESAGPVTEAEFFERFPDCVAWHRMVTPTDAIV